MQIDTQYKPGDIVYRLGAQIEECVISEVTIQLKLDGTYEEEVYIKNNRSSLDISNLYTSRRQAALQWLAENHLDQDLNYVMER